MIVDVFQDTVCPWCRIGKKNLDRARSRWEGEPVTLRWRPFLLHPGMPAEGRDFIDHMAAIKGDRNVQPLIDRVCAAGEACEVTFRFDQVAKAPNTLLSHVLIAAAPAGQQEAVIEAVYRAYFEDGQDIGERETLLAIATAAGLDREAAAAALDDQTLRAETAEQAAWARGQGITGVPFFVFDNAVGISGAQPPDVILDAMRQATAVGAR